MTNFVLPASQAVALQPKIATDDKGRNLKLMITNTLSGGNAFIGHKKSVSIEAGLYKDGKLVNTYTGTRNSGGGFGAGFKGSCKVLERCVKALGKDVAKWVNNQSK